MQTTGVYPTKLALDPDFSGAADLESSRWHVMRLSLHRLGRYEACRDWGWG